jgi:hypothetical protein
MVKRARKPVNEDRRAHVMGLLASGLILQTEAAKLAGTTRQVIHQWATRAGMRPGMARRRYLRALMVHDHPRD